MNDAIKRIEETQPRRFRRYAEYMDSGIDWLGEIPAHWHLKRLKYAVAHLESGGTPESDNLTYWTDEEHGIPWVAISDMTRDFHLNVTAKRITEQGRMSKRLRILPAGTLLYSMYASLGRVALLETRAVINQAILGVVPHGNAVLRDYLRWWFEFMQAHVQMLSSSNTQDNLSAERVRKMPVVLPIVNEEQSAIADFLDRETAKIDGLVARKERLIELLQEKRTALITRAVTRGLDPNVPKKDSGVEWLGDIPAHWQVMSLKHLLKQCDYGISESLEGSGDIRVLTMAHIQGGEVVLPDDGSISGVDPAMLLKFGDLLFNRTNSRELVAKVGMFRGNRGDQVTFASYLVRLTVREGVEPQWLNYLLNSSGVLGMARSMALLSVNQANLNPTKYQQIVVPTYVLSEQLTIAAFLDRETAKIDSLIAKVRQAIDHLKEFRTTLIFAAVTGKIDVREETS